MAKMDIIGDDGGGVQKNISVDLPSNSHKKKTNPLAKPEPKQAIERPKMNKVITGSVIRKKKGFFARSKEAIFNDDAASVGNYVLNDVVIPAIKSMLFETFTQGLERSLFGATNTRPARNDRGRHIPYSRMSTSADKRNERMTLSAHDRATHTFDKMIIESRAEGEEILDRLSMLIEEFGSARVSDFYGMMDISAEHTDTRWGWYSLQSSGMRQTREGWMIILPRPEPLD